MRETLFRVHAIPYFQAITWLALVVQVWMVRGKARMQRGLLLSGCAAALALPAPAQTFTTLPTQPPDNIYSIVADPMVPTTLYACCGSAVIKSVDSGSSWSIMGSTFWSNINTLYITPSGQLYAGAEASFIGTGGVFQYNGSGWTLMTGSPRDVTALLLDPVTNHLFAGTGYTNNAAVTNVQPINFGTGVWEYNGTTWAQVNTGINPVSPTYANTVFLFIKALARLPSGAIVAATYGNGVLTYASGSWTPYGSGLSNSFVNCLEIGPSGELYAGTDDGIYVTTGGAWTAVQTGLPHKPVRALVYAGGKLVAGLCYFQYQRGSIQGEIYEATLGTGSWTSISTGFNSTSVLDLIATPTKVLAAACGIWARPLTGGSWTYSMGGAKLPNRVFQLVHNSQGHLFAMCSNQGAHGSSPANGFGFGGMFRSTDNGTTWVPINYGINYPALTAIMVDSHDHLWLTARRFKGASPTLLWGNPELYKSTDNGDTWVQNTAISTGVNEDGFPFIAEAPSGRIYVAHAFGSNTTVSATDDYGLTFDNTVTDDLIGQKDANNMSIPNPNRVYGLSINAANDVFVGSETAGVLRSTSNGATHTFTDITTPAPNAPYGNNTVYVDPYTGTVFSSGIHGKLGGNLPANLNKPKNNYCSLPANNGLNMFQFNGPADYSSFEAMICDNRGNFYGNLNGSSTVSGVYTAAPPFTSSTAFTRLPYFFKSFMMDDCGYLYGMNVTNGANIYKSTLPVNTPLPSKLVTPAAGATGVQPSITFVWASKCSSETFKLQISQDVNFAIISYSQTGITGTSFTPPANTLAPNNRYYWRLQSTNAAGTSAWSTTSNFTTPGGTLPVTLVSFSAVQDARWPRVNLTWQTTANSTAPYYEVQKSTDGHTFENIAKVPALQNVSGLAQYSATDEHLTDGTSYYRLGWPGDNGSPEHSVVVAVATTTKATCFAVTINPAAGQLVVASSCVHPMLQVQVLNLAGSSVARTTLSSQQNFTTIPLTRLTSGVYIVRVHDDRGQAVSTTKIVVE